MAMESISTEAHRTGAILAQTIPAGVVDGAELESGAVAMHRRQAALARCARIGRSRERELRQRHGPFEIFFRRAFEYHQSRAFVECEGARGQRGLQLDHEKFTLHRRAA